ncbi:hypothetical protein [Olleya sp. HaHaR_3_96]|uniref:hypothetical protein n=1 Tax=Olleya sp. HaHaR_3_96 TaxID=2745560 RepID=UPI001C4FBDE2|nr:hypothetical protein [Olleya sp. HaHaR_3_96]QXP60668.1 hypothetical protein H0I26_03230 [Olleya sp. HaHaR_3_96]
MNCRLSFNLIFVLMLLTSCGNKRDNISNNIDKKVIKKENTKTQSNLLNWKDAWVVGIGSVPGFKSFGKEEESRRVKGVNFDFEQDILWECIPDNSTTWDGGFGTDYLPIDNQYAYRFTSWVKKTNGKVGRTFYAVTGVTETTGQVVKNANFVNAGFVPEKLEDWYLLVGYIYPYDYEDDVEKQPISGVYYLGEKVAEGRDFKWDRMTDKAAFRTLLNNCKNSLEERLYISEPTLYKIDGTEPKLKDVI